MMRRIACSVMPSSAYKKTKKKIKKKKIKY